MLSSNSYRSLGLAVMAMMMLITTPSFAQDDGVLSSYSSPPFPPSNCQNRAGTNQYNSGYQAAWRVIKRNWDTSNGCSDYDSFIQTVRNVAPGGWSCQALGYKQAIDDSTVQINHNCASDCADVGDVTGSSGASIFCGMTYSAFRRYDTNKCTRIGLWTCRNAFQSTVASQCPDQLDTFQYQSEMNRVCSPSGLGQ
jgi:hypothetical protein